MATITPGSRQALDTPSLRRDFHVRLRENLANDNSNVWQGIQKIQAERVALRNKGAIGETVNAMERYLELGKQNRASGLTSEALVHEYGGLKARFDGLFDRKAYGPTLAQVHIDTALTTLMISYGQGAFIGGELLPIAKVTARTGKIFKEAIADIQTGEEWMERAPGAEAGEVDVTMETQVSYSVVTYKAKKGVEDEIANSADAPINLDEMAARKVTTVLTGNREIRIATLLQLTTSYATANRVAAPTVKWDNAAQTSDNEHWTDLKAMHNAVSDNSGAPPTDIVMNKRVALALIGKDHFRESTIYVEGALPHFLLGKIAEYCMVDRAHIAFGRKTTSNPGQTRTAGDIWTDTVAMLTVSPPNGNHYMGFGCSPATAALMLARYRDPIEDREREIVWGKEAVDEIVTNDVMGAVNDDVLT